MSMSKDLNTASYYRLVKSKPYFKIFLSCVFIIMLMLYLDRKQKDRLHLQSQIVLADINQQMSESLSESLKLRLNLPNSLASIITIDPKFMTQNFDAITKKLVEDLTGVVSLQLAPNGVITHDTDFTRNQATIGIDLSTNKEFISAIKEQQYTIVGPFTYPQGMRVICGILPVFTNLQPTETTDNFWGFVIVVIDLDVLLAESYISDDHEYNIALRGKDLDGKKGEILFGNQELFDDSIDIRIIDFPGGSWELAVDEKDDNPHKFMPYWNIWLWTIGLILVSLSTYMFISIFNRNKEHAESESIATELRQFIETANAPIFGIDSKGLINEWNQTAEKITGFKKADVLGEDLVKGYITEDYQAAVKEVLDKALVGKETANYEFPLFTKDGYRLMVLLNSSTRRDSEGKITGVLGVGQDISEMDKLKEELEYKVESRTQELSESLEREKELGLLKSRFVAMASHEFRTPLTTINATSDIILKYANKMDQDEINLRLEIIKDEVKGMTVMLEDVLIIGKSDVQKLEYNPESVDVISLIKDIIAGYQLSDSENRTFIYHLSSTVIMAKIDKKWIKNIIINLVSNAVKYSDQDTDIEVSINRDQDNISFSFKDYGIGISKEDIKLLFEPFYRGSNVNEVSGSGLGLAVLQKAVNLHKGKIEIESEIGKGSIFTVTLPIV